MREIIFRGKSADNGEWLFGVPIFDWYSGGKTANIINVGLIECCDENMVIPETIGQYTGLKDKNGKKIFEGDIVRFIWWWFDGAERESELTGTIVYSSDNMSFQLKGVKNKEWRDFVGANEHDMDYLTPFSELNFCDADFEVIGNIHDNPELLS